MVIKFISPDEGGPPSRPISELSDEPAFRGVYLETGSGVSSEQRDELEGELATLADQLLPFVTTHLSERLSQALATHAREARAEMLGEVVASVATDVEDDDDGEEEDRLPRPRDLSALLKATSVASQVIAQDVLRACARGLASAWTQEVHATLADRAKDSLVDGLPYSGSQSVFTLAVAQLPLTVVECRKILSEAVQSQAVQYLPGDFTIARKAQAVGTGSKAVATGSKASPTAAKQ